MKIIIVGAGQVGTSVAEGLVNEENDITVVDQDGPRLQFLQNRYDLRTVCGNATTPSTLRDAGAEIIPLLVVAPMSVNGLIGKFTDFAPAPCPMITSTRKCSIALYKTSSTFDGMR